MHPIRWGILSTGRIAGAFARDLAFVDNAVLAAVGSRMQASADAFAQQHSVPTAHGSYEALCADPDVDAIYVATPHTMHLANSALALRAGKAVLCEKPLAPTPEAARDLIDVAEATGGYLLEAMWTHFLPAIQTAKRWVDEGRIGTLRHVKADFGYPIPYAPHSREYSPVLGGGSLLDMGVYPIALTWLFLQQHPSEVQVVARRAASGVDNDVSMLFTYPEVTATLGCSFRCRLGNGATIVGADGYITIPDFFRARSCALYHMDELVERFEDSRESQGYAFEASAVGEDLRTGRQQSEVVPWESTLAIQDHMARVITAM